MRKTGSHGENSYAKWCPISVLHQQKAPQVTGPQAQVRPALRSPWLPSTLPEPAHSSKGSASGTPLPVNTSSIAPPVSSASTSSQLVAPYGPPSTENRKSSLASSLPKGSSKKNEEKPMRSPRKIASLLDRKFLKLFGAYTVSFLLKHALISSKIKFGVLVHS